MIQEQFTQAIRRQPFHPFELRLVDGRSFTVDHPDFVAISRAGREITFYADDNTCHLIDGRLVTELVVALEDRPAGTIAPNPNGGE